MFVLQRVRPATLLRKRELSTARLLFREQRWGAPLRRCPEHPPPPCRGTCGSVRLVGPHPQVVATFTDFGRRASLAEVVATERFGARSAGLGRQNSDSSEDLRCWMSGQRLFGAEFA